MAKLSIVHFSDIHLPFPEGSGGGWGMVHPKRALAVVNYVLRRARRYAGGMEKIRALHAFLDAHPADFLFYTGDSVNYGLESELLRASRTVRGLLSRARIRALAVPGNHDFYTPRAVRDYAAAFSFCEPAGGRPEAVELSAQAAAVTLSSAVPHLAFWDSTGAVPAEELDRLAEILDSDAMRRKAVVFLLMHYPAKDARNLHALRHPEALLAFLAAHPNVQVCHGHKHWRSVEALSATQNQYGAGSLTGEGRAGFWRYELDGGVLTATPYRYASAAFYPDA